MLYQSPIHAQQYNDNNILSSQTSNFSDVLSLYRKKILNSRRDPQRIWLSSEQGVLMVRNNPGFVYIAEAASAYVFVRKHYQPHEICELNEILLRDETTAYTMVSKTSSFAELIRYKFVNYIMKINQAINKPSFLQSNASIGNWNPLQAL